LCDSYGRLQKNLDRGNPAETGGTVKDLEGQSVDASESQPVCSESQARRSEGVVIDSYLRAARGWYLKERQTNVL
jgi:hypothetical protein